MSSVKQSKTVTVLTSKFSFTGIAVVVSQSQLWGHSGQMQSHSSNNSGDLVEEEFDISVVVNTVCSTFSSAVVVFKSSLELAVVSVICIFGVEINVIIISSGSSSQSQSSWSA